jgi:hypothetical protein
VVPIEERVDHGCLKERSRSFEQFTADHSDNVPISDFSPTITAALLTSMRSQIAYAVEQSHTTQQNSRKFLLLVLVVRSEKTPA